MADPGFPDGMVPQVGVQSIITTRKQSWGQGNVLDLLVILFTGDSLSRGISVQGLWSEGCLSGRAPPQTEIPDKVNNG